MFDKVTLLYEGRQIYFGPISAAKQYFVDLGFTCADLATTADFLTSLTNPEERIVREGYELRVPRTPEDFEHMWRASTDRTRLIQELDDSQLKHSNEAEEIARLQQARRAEKTTRWYADGELVYTHGDTCSYNLSPRVSPYTVSFSRQTMICIARGFQRLLNNLSVPISGIIGNAIMGAITGSVFYNLQPDTGSFYTRGALIFFATLINATSSAFEVCPKTPFLKPH